MAHFGIDDIDAAAALHVTASEFVVATADTADVPAYDRLRALLTRVRSAFGIEAAFVSEWAAGAPLLRALEAGGNALHHMYGSRLLDAPAPRGAAIRFDTVPVVTGNGFELGTLCSRRVVRKGEDDDAAAQGALQSVARLIAGWFEEAELAGASA